MESIFNSVQDKIMKSQKQIQRKINLLQNKNASGGKALQRQLAKQEADGIRDAMKELEKLKPYYLWNILAEKQANTLKLQLNIKIKDFPAATECAKNCLLLDPLSFAMHMTLLYKNKQTEELEKAYKKAEKKFKGDKIVIITALYTWILVKERKIDEAVVILKNIIDKTKNETLTNNWKVLANGKINRFSNAPLGDQWYALGLEEPKQIRIKQRRMNKHMR